MELGLWKCYISLRTMKEAHAALGIVVEDFNFVANALSATLLELGVVQNLVDEVIAIAASTKGDVVTA